MENVIVRKILDCQSVSEISSDEFCEAYPMLRELFSYKTLAYNALLFLVAQAP